MNTIMEMLHEAKTARQNYEVERDNAFADAALYFIGRDDVDLAEVTALSGLPAHIVGPIQHWHSTRLTSEPQRVMENPATGKKRVVAVNDFYIREAERQGYTDTRGHDFRIHHTGRKVTATKYYALYDPTTGRVDTDHVIRKKEQHVQYGYKAT